MSSGNFGVILAGSVQIGLETISIDGGYCDLPGADCSSVFALFGFGAGFIFSDRISLVPQLLLPTEGDLGYLLTVNIAVGKRM
jgi:hypothetical protein